MDRSLQITGRGSLSVAPDIVILHFTTEAHEMEFEETINNLNSSVEALRLVIEGAGIERKYLKTKGFNIRKDTVWNRKTEKQDFNGFRASHSLELELPIERGLINSLLRQIARQLSNLDFTIAYGVRDGEHAQQQVILQAISQAKENSILIAGATGVELKEILNIDFSFKEVMIRSRSYNYPLYEADMLAESTPSPDFEPDDIDLTETITITWRIG